MPQYRKKPITIEAWQVPNVPKQERMGREQGLQARAEFNSIGEWLGEDGQAILDAVDGPCFLIETLEGTMKARAGDFVIRGVQGEFCPCKPDIFAATYEAVDADA